MTETEMLIDVWNLIKSYVPAKDKSVVANKFVDIIANSGLAEEDLQELLGHDEELDEAIQELRDYDKDEFEDYGDGYGEERYEDY